MENLNSQIAMITGGATGIGKAIVERFVSLGAKVACCYNKSCAAAEDLAEKLNREATKVLPVRLDVTDSHQVKSAVDSIEEHFGQSISVLINNAGDIIKTMPIEETTEEIWDRVMDVNLKGTFLCSKYCVPQMKSKRYGRIINISSLAARAGGGPGSIPYAVSKGGVETFTRGLAKELGPFNITVNAVAPGVIDTLMPRIHNVAGDLEEFAKKVALLRIGAPEEVAGVVAFLASHDASYITGETVAVNGGVRMD